MVKDELIRAVESALEDAKKAGDIRIKEMPEVEIDVPRKKEFGDYSTNVAMVLAREIGAPPREIAQRIADRVTEHNGVIDKVQVAGAGFINFYLKPDWYHQVILRIHDQGERYGTSERFIGQSILVEYVSANPNGPITVGSGRGGAIGDVVSNLLEAVGYRVFREYYINDALNSLQMQNFGKSLEVRYLQLLGHDVKMPEDGYQGEYVIQVAKDIVERDGDKYVHLPKEDRIALFTDMGEYAMLELQKADLEDFGIAFDNWYSERTLHESSKVTKCIEQLKERGYAYEKEGAIWLRSTAFGDDKDRTLVRSNGQPTYIAADTAYHADKFERGFNRLLNVWGPHHHGYIARTKAAVAALGYDPNRLDVLIFQVVRLFSGGELVMMSKRRGDLVPLRELVDEVGKDAARFFLLMRSADSSLDFDLELAKQQSSENPVYYVQYAHARISSILRQAEESGVPIPSVSDVDLSLITHPSEIDLVKKLSDWPGEIDRAATAYEPHRLTAYSTDLAALFHVFYRDCRVLGESPELTAARLVLVQAARVVLANVLGMMGISAPEKM
ncbi:MAG: arginine--tRNA ligase [Armatimonadetes bacterium]|nr:arginine--tRNA ligase [Armatimonadota bacterium]